MKIQKVKAENRRVKSLFFHDELCTSARAGQFIMVWIPGVDEIPVSLSWADSDNSSSITVAEIGEATKSLNKMAQGDVIGIRGPFGNHFRIVGEKALVIGGGIGMAPLTRLVKSLIVEGVKTTVIEGVETRDELLFSDQLESLAAKAGVEAFFTTEDGSCGIKGLATDTAEKILSSGRFDVIYTCGPEKMIRKVYFLAEQYRTPLQTCLERLMRCAVGICGSCVIGRYRVCKDGPVFDGVQLKEVEKELGEFKRDFNGEKIRIRKRNS